MSKRKALITKFYMVRLEGGEWSPRAKHGNLADAVKEAARLSKEFGKQAVVLMSTVVVKTKGDQVLIEDANPET
jgi:hypothetical protein